MENFPGGSRKRVNAAGGNVRAHCATDDDIRVIDDWRAAHRSVLNTFQAILRNRTHGTEIIVAQRHKRKSTIFGKLGRYPKMKLARMDDVAGCRLIFKSIDDLYAFRKTFHEARFRHTRRNDIDKYDYIKCPKPTGYRGVHDVYDYDVNSANGRALKGLMVEIQYRTTIQHAWATAVEVIGFITGNEPKLEKGDARYMDAMSLASEILARAFEGCKGPFPDLGNTEVVQRFLKIDNELGLLTMLGRLNAAHKENSTNRNMILIFPPDGDLEIRSYRNATEALRALFDLEEERPRHDIVLVKADTSEEIRFAFKNYFSDAQEFVSLVEDGCVKLSGKSLRNRAVATRRKRRTDRSSGRP